jgi:hypothetical protein
MKWIRHDLYQGKRLAIIMSKKPIKPEDAQKVFEWHIEKEKKRLEANIRAASVVAILYTGD